MVVLVKLLAEVLIRVQSQSVVPPREVVPLLLGSKVQYLHEVLQLNLVELVVDPISSCHEGEVLELFLLICQGILLLLVFAIWERRLLLSLLSLLFILVSSIILHQGVVHFILLLPLQVSLSHKLSNILSGINLWSLIQSCESSGTILYGHYYRVKLLT